MDSNLLYAERFYTEDYSVRILNWCPHRPFSLELDKPQGKGLNFGWLDSVLQL